MKRVNIHLEISDLEMLDKLSEKLKEDFWCRGSYDRLDGGKIIVGRADLIRYAIEKTFKTGELSYSSSRIESRLKEIGGIKNEKSKRSRV